jgi:hypothetical protein
MSSAVVSATPALVTSTENASPQVESTLPEELKLPDRKDLLSLVPELGKPAAELERSSTTLTQIVPKLEEILKEIRGSLASTVNQPGNTAGIKEQLPEHPNTA